MLRKEHFNPGVCIGLCNNIIVSITVILRTEKSINWSCGNSLCTHHKHHSCSKIFTMSLFSLKKKVGNRICRSSHSLRSVAVFLFKGILYRKSQSIRISSSVRIFFCQITDSSIQFKGKLSVTLLQIWRIFLP